MSALCHCPVQTFLLVLLHPLSPAWATATVPQRTPITPPLAPVHQAKFNQHDFPFSCHFAVQNHAMPSCWFLHKVIRFQFLVTLPWCQRWAFSPQHPSAQSNSDIPPARMCPPVPTPWLLSTLQEQTEQRGPPWGPLPCDPRAQHMPFSTHHCALATALVPSPPYNVHPHLSFFLGVGFLHQSPISSIYLPESYLGFTMHLKHNFLPEASQILYWSHSPNLNSIQPAILLCPTIKHDHCFVETVSVGAQLNRKFLEGLNHALELSIAWSWHQPGIQRPDLLSYTD